MSRQGGCTAPTADETRPRTCPRCGQPACEGERCGYTGMKWCGGGGSEGPTPGRVAVKREVACGLYRCKAYTAVLTMLPASTMARKHFSAVARELALTLWGRCGWSAAQVRAVVGGRTQARGRPRGWRTLARWGPAGGGRMDGGTVARPPIIAEGIAWPDDVRPLATLDGPMVLTAHAALQRVLARFPKEYAGDCSYSAKVTVGQEGGLYFVEINRRVDKGGWRK